jgi:hypothetical protein
MSFPTSQANPAAAVPVYIGGPTSASYTSISGTITLGGTAQVLQAAQSRRGIWIQNNSAGDLWINDLGATAVLAQPSIRLATNAVWQTPDGGASPLALSIIGATTAQAWTGRVW